MITHIALFKLVHANTETVEEARKVLAVMARFDSIADLEAYQRHPAYVEVVKYLQGVRQSVVTVDYETP